MTSTFWRRQFIMITASMALATGAAHATSMPHSMTNARQTASDSATTGVVSRTANCGHGGEGGQGGAGGKGGAPGQPGQPGQPGNPSCLRTTDLLPAPGTANLSSDDQARIALAVMAGQLSTTEAARRYKVTEADIEGWKQRFPAGDWSRLIDEIRNRAGFQDAALRTQIDKLKSVLGESYIQRWLSGDAG